MVEVGGCPDFILFFLILKSFIMKFTFHKGHSYDQITQIFSSFLRPALMILVGVLLWGG